MGMFSKPKVSFGSAVVNAQGGGGLGGLIDNSTGGKAKGQVQQVGDDIAAKSPFKKPNLNDMPDVVDPQRIQTGAYDNPDLAFQPVDQVAINTAPQTQFRNYQLGLAKQLADQAAGRGPSLAAQQAQTTMNQGIAQQFAMQNSARGGNNAAMQRQAMMAGSDMSAQVTQQSAMARLAEQQQASQMLNQVSGSGRQQDINLGVESARLGQAAAMKNADMQVQKAQLAAQYASMGLDARKANMMADLQVQGMIQNRTAAANGQILQADQANKQMWGSVIKGIGTGAAMAVGGPGAGAAAGAAMDSGGDDGSYNIEDDEYGGKGNMNQGGYNGGYGNMA